ncbi:MAG TPA: hypothetical protein VF040_05520 [Ktedonobacterales bacterium]
MGNEPVQGTWREEWPPLSGSPEQTPLPPWLSSTDSAPSSRMPSAPLPNGMPTPQENSWASRQNSGQGNDWNPPSVVPQSGPFSADYGSNYPSYYGPDSQAMEQRGMSQQMQSQPMPPMFLVNPSEAYPPDVAMTPYGMPPGGPLSIPAFPAPVPAPVPASVVGSPALSPGTALKNGRYRIIQRYMSGSAGSDTEPPLMIATDTELPSERVLVQELPLATVSPEDAEYIRHGIVERMDTLSQMAGIAHLRDSFVDHRRPFLVFEMPTGDRLLDRLQRAHGPLPETTVISIILQVLDILAALERGPVPVIHGNINPANIILRPGGQVALVGFSSTLLIFPTGQVTHGPAGALTHYSAPEQARGTADIRSDLYATCAVMHHAVTGQEPVGRMFPLARHANPAVSLELEDILSQGLRPSPGQRYQTAEELHEILAPLASGKRLTHVDEELDPNSPTGLRPLRDAQGRLMGPRQRVTQNPLLYIGTVLLLILILGGGVLFNTLQARSTTSNSPSQTLTSAFAPYYQSNGIGLSGGEFVFDTTQSNYAEKQKGALAMAVGDIQGALKAYRTAIASQPNDVESLIYAADLQVLVENDPYVTVIAGVAFGAQEDGGGDAAARYELQGIYLAQQRFNQSTTTPGHIRMRVLILNSGANPSDAQLVSKLMLEQVRKGNVQHFVGIIGWPESNQSRLAMAALHASGLPVISPFASANNLRASADNFYSLVPSDSQQAVDLANAAGNDLQAHRVLVAVDPNDQQSSLMATSFGNQFQSKFDQTAVFLGQAPYDSTTMADASTFNRVVATALSQNADLIYLVGNHTAAIFLADAVAQQFAAANRLAPHILIGPQFNMAPFFGMGDDPAAKAAHDHPDALGLIYMATLASVDQWNALHLAPQVVSTFTNSFSTLFKSFWGAGGLSMPGSLAILSYDATNLLIATMSNDLKVTKKGIVVPSAQQMKDALAQFTSDHPFVGLGGAVAFTGTDHQPNKALGIYTLLPIPNAPDGSSVMQLQMVSVVGGMSLFCGQSDCNPTN